MEESHTLAAPRKDRRGPGHRMESWGLNGRRYLPRVTSSQDLWEGPSPYSLTALWDLQA